MFTRNTRLGYTKHTWFFDTNSHLGSNMDHCLQHGNNFNLKTTWFQRNWSLLLIYNTGKNIYAYYPLYSWISDTLFFSLAPLLDILKRYYVDISYINVNQITHGLAHMRSHMLHMKPDVLAPNYTILIFKPIVLMNKMIHQITINICGWCGRSRFSHLSKYFDNLGFFLCKK